MLTTELTFSRFGNQYIRENPSLAGCCPLNPLTSDVNWNATMFSTTRGLRWFSEVGSLVLVRLLMSSCAGLTGLTFLTSRRAICGLLPDVLALGIIFLACFNANAVFPGIWLVVVVVVAWACAGMLEDIVLRELLEFRRHDFVRYSVSGDVGLKLPDHVFCSCRFEAIYR